MLESVEGLAGDHLDLDTYLDELDRRSPTSPAREVWKVERRQHFRRPESVSWASASWAAFSEGRWEESLRLLEEDRPALEKQMAADAQAGVTVRRVRVVEWPLAPCLQWELHSLRLRALCGEHIRIVGPGAVACFERNGPVPEVATLGTEVAYASRYTEEGALHGGVRLTEPVVVAGCAADIAGLFFEAGEDIGTYFAREIAPLAPPAVPSIRAGRPASPGSGPR
jgi:hypothetical protein